MAATNSDSFRDIRDLLSEALHDKRDERERFLAENDEECKRIESALGALGGQLDIRLPRPRLRGRPGRPRGSKNSTSKRTASGNGRRGRPRGSGSQLIKFLRLAKTHPQSTNQEIADHLGVQLTTATTFVSKVKREGLITREKKRLTVTADGQALLNDTNEKQRAQRKRQEKQQRKSGSGKTKASAKSKGSKASKASSKKAGGRKRGSRKSAAAKASKTAPATGGDAGGAVKAPAGEAETNGGGSSSDQGGGDGEKKSTNLLYDKG